MDVVTKKSEPLRIGLPTNSRIAKDLEPLRDAMRLEGKQGILRSSKYPNIIFRELRARDIASLLLSTGSMLNLGLIGQDTMIEESLQLSTRSQIAEIIQIEAGGPVAMRVLVRKNERLTSTGEEQCVVTSYPTITISSVLKNLQFYLARLRERRGRSSDFSDEMDIIVADGKVESLVRSQDFGPTAAGVDIVRKGDTAREFELELLGEPILVSRPALFGRGNIATQINLAADCIGFIRESLRDAGISFSDGDGFDFYKKLKPWKAPQ